MASAVRGPLEGVRVLELGSFIAGPFAGQLLGDYGAEVIKIEPPGEGDPMRRWGITKDGQSLWWPAIARNKRSVAIDLRAAEGRALVRRVAANCDIVLENFRPGRLDEWGLGYQDLAAANQGVILVHVSGFGQTGPRAGDAGFGSIGEAMGGIRYTTGSPDRAPARAGVSLGDALAGLFAVIGSLAALAERSRTGRGQEVDVAIYEAVAALMESVLADYEIGGVLRGRSGSVLPGVAPSNVYTSADGVDIVLAANADSVFRRLCEAMGQPELKDDPRYREHGARGANMAELDEVISAWAATRDARELLDVLAAHGIPAGRIFTAADMLTDAHYAARDMIIRLASRVRPDAPMLGIVPKFSRTPGVVDTPGPELGAHTRQVLTELAHVDDEEWLTLAAAGLVA
jgi:formyl-CoA transferase/succinyl-CoA--D-citramalate CoA-transferase